ncbi:MAG TPA: metallophosphoesterase family protein [Herpetosiphonaceae bacterium]|nr:metallophosphoesterase family protein [Herpetosiphonaceae bacterium]
MDRIAVISDLHGNLTALHAALDDIRRREITRIFCLGDLIGKGPRSAEVVDLSRAVCELTVRGNWDEFILDTSTDDPVKRWHQQQLGPERLGYLAGLPNTIEFLLSGRQVRLFHASQVSVFHRIHMDDTPERHLAMFDNTAFTGDGPPPSVVGYGDIHDAYVKNFAGHCLFNAGSVGNPLDMPLAAYAILEGRYGDAAPGPFSIQIARLPYDIEAEIRAAEELAMPDLPPYADELRTARYRGAPKEKDK